MKGLGAVYMKIRLGIVAASFLLLACSNDQEEILIDPTQYQVKTPVELQQRIDQLNHQLETDFLAFKKKEMNAFAHQFPLDSNNLNTLNQHLVASTSLKPTKVAYCDLMNSYFSDLYRLGQVNLNLLDQIELSNAKNENLKVIFSNSDEFYHFILDRYTTYRQVQQTMGYGCNLKAAL